MSRTILIYCKIKSVSYLSNLLYSILKLDYHKGYLLVDHAVLHAPYC